jgi:Ca2+-binding RTX toxin-like protein
VGPEIEVLMNKAILLCGVGAIAIAGAFFFLGGGENSVVDPEFVTVAVPEKNLLVSRIDGIGDVLVAGPCQEGNQGNNIFPEEGSVPSDCYLMMSNGRDYLDARSFMDPVFVQVSQGTDSVFLGPGDDIIEVRGNFEIVIDAGLGENVLNFPGLDVPDVDLRVEGADIILESKRGNVRMLRQYPRDGEAAPIQKIFFESGAMSASEIYLKSIDGQASDGDDILTGTPQDDVIYPGLGNDVIAGLEGNDAIHYEGGNDIIMGSFEGQGNDSVLLPYGFEEVFLESIADRDLKLILPGGSLTLQFQIFFPIGNERTNIESFVFTDGIYSDADLRAALASGEKERPVHRGNR